MSLSFIRIDKWKNECCFLFLQMRYSTETNRISYMSIITSISQSRLKGVKTLGSRLVIIHFQGIENLRNTLICSMFIYQNGFIISITSLVILYHFKVFFFKIIRLYFL